MKRLVIVVSVLILSLQAPAAMPAEQFDTATFAGKVVVIDFWASWCVPCRRSFPWLNAMHDKYGDDGLVIIGVNLDESKAAAQEFLAQYPPKFEIRYDESKQMAQDFDVIAMPMSFVIGRDGQQIARHFGFKVKKQDEYESIIVNALRNKE